MATIGNSLAPYFTATTSDVFSANGTGTTFTLTRSISNLVDIEVLVNNIQQNPFNGAYSVNGNTLTFSEAPSAGANNVLVSYRQAVIGSSIPTPNTVASISLQRDLTLGGNTTSNGTMFTQALVPTANVTYDIGTSTLRYKDIYLSGATINLGDVSLSASGNTFTVANSTGGTLPSSMGNTTIAGTANVTGDMTIGGNLTVTGTMTYINTTDVNIGDAIISLNADLAANIAPTEDAGISINRGASTNAQFKWIESTDNWSLGNTTVSGILNANDTIITGTANVSVGINVGANVNLSTAYMDVGNSTVNTTITNITVSTNTVNVASIINVGANVNLSTSQINVGNSTVNTVISATALTTTSNTVTLGTAVYVAANGNVGVGTSPGASYRFDISGGLGLVVRGGTDGSVAIRGATGYSNFISFNENSIADRAAIGFANGSGNLQFRMGGYNMSSGTQSMTLDVNGNLGIGTTSPVSRLNISDGAAMYAAGTGEMIQLRRTPANGNNTTSFVGINFCNGSNGFRIGYGGATDRFRFIDGGDVEILSLVNGGNVGIGTSSPLEKLMVSGPGVFTGQLQDLRASSMVVDYQSGIGGRIISTGPNASTHAPITFATTTTTTYAERMIIDSAGNVGIGTTTPSTGKFSDAAYAFLIQSASTTNGTNLFASNSDNSKFVGFWSGHSSAEPAVGVKTGNALTFGKWAAINGTGGFTENMRISSDGTFQVGRTGGSAPDGKLQVIASGTGAGTAGTKLGFALIEDDSGNAAGLWLGSMTNENTGVIGSRTASGNIGFQTYNGGWGERVRITYDGSFKITQSPGKYSVDVSGGGTVVANGGTVDFPYASGMLVVNNWNNGAVSIYLCGSGNVQLVSSVTAQVGTFAYNAGIAGYTWTNNSGVTNAHGFFFVRTRPTA